MIDVGAVAGEIVAGTALGGVGQTHPHELLSRAASGSFDAETLQWVQRGCSAFVNARGAVSLDRCLLLPATRAKWNRVKRDKCLCDAASFLPAMLGLTSISKQLADEYRRFIERGPWQAWRELEVPPADASRLRKALFQAAKAAGGRSLSDRQIERVLDTNTRRNVERSRTS